MPQTELDPTPEDNSPVLITRRRMFSLLAATGASLFFSSGRSEAFFNFFDGMSSAPSNTLQSLNIPLEWKSKLGSNLAPYAHYLRTANLKNITVRQMIAPHTKSRGTVQNTLPPKTMWRNIRSTAKVIDMLVDRLDVPVKDLVSIYRSPAYNARCAGAKSNSYHLRNNAIDVTFQCAPGKVAAMARAMRSAGLYKGGVGRYGGFTHVDTRGNNVDW